MKFHTNQWYAGEFHLKAGILHDVNLSTDGEIFSSFQLAGGATKTCPVKGNERRAIEVRWGLVEGGLRKWLAGGKRASELPVAKAKKKKAAARLDKEL